MESEENFTDDLDEEDLNIRVNYISNLQNLYHHNNTEINKQLFALAALGFGFNLANFDELAESWMTGIWAGAALGLGVTILCCFLIYNATSKIHVFDMGLLQLESDQNQEEEEEYKKLKKKIDSEINWFNRYKAFAFISFILSIVIMLMLIFLSEIATDTQNETATETMLSKGLKNE